MRTLAQKLEMLESDLNGFNESFLNDFRDLIHKSSEYYKNKTVPISKLTLNSTLNNGTIKCDAYCDSLDTHFREPLDHWRNDYHGYVSLIICVFGTIANILNIIILTRKEMSKTPINSILKWLAVCDMFVMMEYIPFCYHMYLTKKEDRENTYAMGAYVLFHMHFSQILHTISISLTVTLAVWRYIAIKRPHGSLGYIAQHHSSAAIAICFIISPLLCLPNYFVFIIEEVQPGQFRVYPLIDSELFSINFWIHSVIIKLLPCFILTIISFILIDVLCRANKRKLKLKQGYSQPGVNSNGNGRASRLDRRTDRTTMLLVAVLLLFLITEFPQGILGLLSGIMGNCFLTQCYTLFGDVMDLLALINAAIGFVLYGSMSKQFRVTFKSLFLRRRPPKLETTRVTNINHTTTNV